jgi:hypothetical protein
MKFDLRQIIIENDFQIVTMMITKIPTLHKPIPMKHCHLNYFNLYNPKKCCIIFLCESCI